MKKEREGLVSRRRAVQILAFFGVSGPVASRLLAQAPKRVTPEVLQTAMALIDQDFSRERLEVVAPALQRNLDQFQLVRDLEIDDQVEPAAVFMARWRQP